VERVQRHLVGGGEVAQEAELDPSQLIRPAIITSPTLTEAESGPKPPAETGSHAAGERQQVQHCPRRTVSRWVSDWAEASFDTGSALTGCFYDHHLAAASNLTHWTFGDDRIGVVPIRSSADEATDQ